MSTKTALSKALLHQYDFVNSEAKFPALVSGLGAGKTEALVMRVLKFVFSVPNARVGVYAPTVDLIKRIHYPRFEEVLQDLKVTHKLNRSDGILSIWVQGKGKAEIIFRSMDNYARIIGYEVMTSVLDEIDVLPTDKAMEVWIRVLARNRKKFFNPITGERGQNSVGITTTPEGFKFVYTMWMKEHLDNPDYVIIRGRTEDNHHLHPDYVPTLRATYPPQLIDAYLNGLFVNMTGQTVYDGFDRVESNTELTIADWLLSDTIHIGMDFNVGRMSAVVGMKGDNKTLYIVDEFHNLMDTPAMIEAIRARYPTRSIVIYPDASGGSRKSIDASKSDIKLLKNAGFRINAPRKNPPVRERVLSMNTLLLNGERERHMYVNVHKCPEFTEAAEKQVYDNNGLPVKDGGEDILDGCGYLVNRVFGLAKPTTIIGRMRMGI